MRIRIILALVLLLSPLGSIGCADEDAAERWRRYTEGNLDTSSKIAAAEEMIAAIEANLGGIAPGTLAERMDFHQTPGVQIAVVNRGVVEWTQAYGVFDTSTDRPLSRWDRLQAGSISKPVAAFAILQLVEHGLIDLDAPVNDALSSWKIPDNAFTAAEPVTLRHLLAHTSGMNNSGFLGYPFSQPIPTLLQVLTGTAPAANQPFEIVQVPGESFLYSGGAYTVLAQLLEDLTDIPFTHWTLRRLFLPAGMWSSTFEQPLRDRTVYQRDVGSFFGFPTSANVYPELPAAGMWSTALDLARFVVAVQRSVAGERGELLGADIAKGLVTPQSPAPEPEDIGGLSSDPQMGLGLLLADGPEPQWFWHTGGNIGYTGLIVGDTAGGGFGAAVLTNSFPGGRRLAWEIVNGIADLYDWPDWEDWGIQP